MASGIIELIMFFRLSQSNSAFHSVLSQIKNAFDKMYFQFKNGVFDGPSFLNLDGFFDKDQTYIAH